MLAASLPCRAYGRPKLPRLVAEGLSRYSKITPDRMRLLTMTAYRHDQDRLDVTVTVSRHGQFSLSAVRRSRHALVRQAFEQYTALRRRPARFHTTTPQTGQRIIARTRSALASSTSVTSGSNAVAYARITNLRIASARSTRRRVRYARATHAGEQYRCRVLASAARAIPQFTHCLRGCAVAIVPGSARRRHASTAGVRSAVTVTAERTAHTSNITRRAC